MGETITTVVAALTGLVLAGPYLPTVVRLLLSLAQQPPKTLVNPIDQSVVKRDLGPPTTPALHDLVSAWETLWAARGDRPNEYGEHLQYVWGVLTTPRKAPAEGVKP